MSLVVFKTGRARFLVFLAQKRLERLTVCACVMCVLCLSFGGQVIVRLRPAARGRIWLGLREREHQCLRRVRTPPA